MIEREKVDLIAVRPSGETLTESFNAIEKELKSAGLTPSRIVESITQPGGERLFSVYLKGDK